MRLRSDQVGTHLKQKRLLPVYLISGDEPLQKLEAEDQIRHAVKQGGIDERNLLIADKSFNWNDLSTSGDNMSLFSSNTFTELKINSSGPGKQGSVAICDCIDNLADGDILMISMGKIDKRSQSAKWFKAIDAIGAVVQIWPVEAKQLPNWIAQRFQSQGYSIDRAAADFIAERVEGNLLAARQEVDKLCLLVENPKITLKIAMAAVSDSSRYDVFDLVESAFNGDTERSWRLVNGLKKEGAEPIALFGALMWEFRRVNAISHEVANGQSIMAVMSQYKIWQQRQGAIANVIKRHGHKGLDTLLEHAGKLDQTIKGYRKENVWNEFTSLIMNIAGATKLSF